MLGTLCLKKKKSFVSCLLLLAISQYVCILQNTEDILEPSSHFSLLLFCLNFTGNGKKHAGAGSAISAVSVYVYSLSFSGARISRFGLYSEVTI